jgi:CheY-like chemotaxis protein
LIVDDHDGFRRFVRGPLEAAGFTVAEAATGAEATEAARTVRPGLVLLDIQLPDFDRFEVARRLAADPAGGSAPVVMLTSTREASDYGGRIAASPAAGSCQGSAVGAALRRFLARERYRTASSGAASRAGQRWVLATGCGFPGAGRRAVA